MHIVILTPPPPPPPRLYPYPHVIQKIVYDRVRNVRKKKHFSIYVLYIEVK